MFEKFLYDTEKERCEKELLALEEVRTGTGSPAPPYHSAIAPSPEGHGGELDGPSTADSASHTGLDDDDEKDNSHSCRPEAKRLKTHHEP